MKKLKSKEIQRTESIKYLLSWRKQFPEKQKEIDERISQLLDEGHYPCAIKCRLELEMQLVPTGLASKMTKIIDDSIEDVENFDLHDFLSAVVDSTLSTVRKERILLNAPKANGMKYLISNLDNYKDLLSHTETREVFTDCLLKEIPKMQWIPDVVTILKYSTDDKVIWAASTRILSSIKPDYDLTSLCKDLEMLEETSLKRDVLGLIELKLSKYNFIGLIAELKQHEGIVKFGGERFSGYMVSRIAFWIEVKAHSLSNDDIREYRFDYRDRPELVQILDKVDLERKLRNS